MEYKTGAADNPATFNLYAFCNGDPVNYIDPNGHATKPPAWMDWNDDSIIDTQRDRNYFDKNNDYIADWNQGIGSKADYGINTAQRQVYNEVIANKGIVSQATISGLIEPALSEIAGSPEKVVEWAKIAGVSLAQINLDVSSLAIRNLIPEINSNGRIVAINGISDEIREKVISKLAADQDISWEEAEKLYNKDLQEGTLSDDINGTFAYLLAEGVILHGFNIFIGTTQINTVFFKDDRNYGELQEMIDALEGIGNINYDPMTNVSTFTVTNRQTGETTIYTIDVSTLNDSTPNNGMILVNDHIMVGLRWLAEKAGLEPTLSWWNEGDSSYALIVPDMLQNPVHVRREEGNVTIDVYRDVVNEIDPNADPNIVGRNFNDYVTLIDDGFKGWDGVYDIMTVGSSSPVSITVTTNVFGAPLYEGQDVLEVRVMDYKTSSKVPGNNYAGRGSSWNVNDGAIFYTGQDKYIIFDLEWSLGNIKSDDTLKRLATHELGHILGLNDAYLGYTYTDVNTGGTITLQEASTALSPIGVTQTDIMKDNVNYGNAAVTNQDILMMLNAYRFNEWQKYEMYDMNSTTRIREPVQTP